MAKCSLASEGETTPYQVVEIVGGGAQSPSGLAFAIAGQRWGDLYEITPDHREETGEPLGERPNEIGRESASLRGSCRGGERLVRPVDIVTNIESVTG
jgi:hypothetical protein